MDLERIRQANEVELIREANSVEAQRRRASYKIVAEVDRLIDELLIIIRSEDVDPRIKLSAINMLLDRAIPKLGVQHIAPVEEEEAPAKANLRKDIEDLIRKQLDERGGE